MMIRIFQIITYLIFYPLFKLVFKIEIHTSSNLREINIKEPLILAANHIHFLDPIIVGWAYSHVFTNLGYSFRNLLPLRFIAAKEYFNFFKNLAPFPLSLIVASFVRINGSLPVDRNSNESLENKLKEAIKVLEQNGKLMIFPEGKMSINGLLQKGKRGIGYLHKKTKATIIPIALINVYECTKIKNLFKFLLGRRNIKVFLGYPIKDIYDLEIEEIVNKVMDEIKFIIKLEQIEKDEKELKIKFEIHNLLIKLIRSFLIPILNLLSSNFIKKLLHKTTKDSKNILKKPGTTHAIETLYTFHLRKKEIFRKGLLNGFLTLFWHTFLSQPKAIRNRLRIVETLLRLEIENLTNNKQEINILSIGGGSCRAAIHAAYYIKRNFFSNSNKSFKINLFNLDKHLDVLELTKNIINQHNVSDILNFEAVVGNAKQIDTMNIRERFNIIEIVGLLDYFSDDECLKLLKFCYDNLLEQNGILIWGNIISNNEMKFIKNIGWPNMYYRTIVDIGYIIRTYDINLEKTVIYKEPLGIHYIMLTKKL